MKKLFFAIFILPLIVSCASAPAVIPPEQRVVQRTIEVPKEKNELYSLSMEWVAKTFKPAKAVIQYEDKEEGKIIGKGFIIVKYGMGVPFDTYFTLTIETKDNRIRATIDNIYILTTMSGQSQEMLVDNDFSMNQCFKPEADKLLDSFSSYLQKGTATW